MYSEIASNKRKSILLASLFIAVIILLGWIFDQVYVGGKSYTGIIIAIFLSFGLTAISYFQGDKIALLTTGAKLLEHDENQRVYHLVENLCIASGTPIPKIYLIEDPAINAFATGRKPEIASIALTRGAIEKLTDNELEGVIAHELSHIKNYDIRFMMLVAVMVGSISILANILLRSGGLTRGKGGNDREGGSQLFAILMIVGIVLAILSPLIAELIKLAISRRREFLADASGALLTRYPEGLARALEKISAEAKPMRTASSATAHLFIASPFSAKSFSKLFSTHPPVEERIKKLRTMGA
ncbi:MAG: zinc metalloprotease HtpX [Candidatus Magasanikbacteria bacterium CG10_big_fil_rev_8_21_14_0_10_36_32]|uniref:Protease HtpX homolog n=1 Tax=Candidatus Magasanikbacteria bacterium CG10_big_fil_rev_8_21_14_0_10_36_32 TaxID=1974646 RepID=A0A2M6W6J9_9BACT|nr:MAG: zinc metalloprotease HtpX [Candidatus Magasanikbacteria bacterium CG10_big_fil_rev_8_21_14_0_10_36_32]